MADVPIISVITPSYNQGQYIEETILSVISQEGDFQIDYLIMDGGSTDGTVEVIRKYAEMIDKNAYPHRCRGVALRWVSEKDKGQTDAINKGIRQSKGSILTYINSDDAFSPGAFANVARCFRDHPEADFVFGDGEVIDEKGAVSWVWLSRPYDHSVMLSYHYLWNDFTNYIMQQATFWRRSVVDRIGMFDDSFHYAMDAEYWIRAGDAGMTLLHLPKNLGRFRMIQGTKSLSSPTVFWEDYMEIFRKYRRNSGLIPFFAFYYFNLAKQHGFDLEKAFGDDVRLFNRWSGLAPDIQRSLRIQANRGKMIGQLLVSDEFRKSRNQQAASRLLYDAVQREPMLVLQPLGIYHLLKFAISRVVGARVDDWQEKFSAWYRRTKVNYRYHTKENAAAHG